MTSTNALLAWDVDLKLNGETLLRQPLRDTLSPIAHIVGMKDVELTFKTEWKGVGAAPGTAANIATFELDRLLSGCSFNTGTLNSTSITYALLSNDSSLNSLSFYVHFGDSNSGNRHKVVGSRGSFKLTMEAGKFGVAEWSFKGLYNSVIAATLPGLAGISSLQPPVIYNASFQIGGFSPVCSKAEIDMGVDVTRRESLNTVAGVHSFRQTARNPKLNFNADAVVESSNPFWGDWEGNVVDTFGITIGTNANNRCDISGYFEYVQPAYGDADGVRIYDCEAAIKSSAPSTGNDELTIKFW
jgi:hypothetical protein